MASRRRSADNEGDEPKHDDRGAPAGAPPVAPPQEVPAPPAWPPPTQPAQPIQPAQPPPTSPAAEPARPPLAQARYERLVAAAGIDPNRDLSDHARSVLDWLARQDDATCSGVVELLQATSVAAIRRRP